MDARFEAIERQLIRLVERIEQLEDRLAALERGPVEGEKTGQTKRKPKKPDPAKEAEQQEVK